MKTTFRKGSRVMVSPKNDNENYDSFRDKVLIVTHVATSYGRGEGQHPGYDSGIGEALYDLKTEDGEEIGSSLYDYELVRA